MKIGNVLSLFNGMSCCNIALDRAGIEFDTMYSAEIDKWANIVTQANYPDTVQLGDVTKWQEWDIDWASIDLVTGGFPCQAWSMAGKQLGDKDVRGMLFWTMLDIMKEVLKHNPKAKFLIENVKMKKEFEQYITHHTEQALGEVHKILINSALVSAQNRNRYYWTNFEVSQPKDRSIMLADIIECDFVDKDKSHCLGANYFKGGNLKSYFEKNRRQLVFKCARVVGRKINPETGKRDDCNPDIKTEQRVESRLDDKSGCLTTVQKDNVIAFADNYVQYDRSGKGYKSQDQRAYYLYGKMGTLAASRTESKTNTLFDLDEHGIKYRKLTPIECERLQTVPDNYTNHVSNTQRYKMLGNGWTVDVIAHIFNCMKGANYD